MCPRNADRMTSSIDTGGRSPPSGNTARRCRLPTREEFRQWWAAEVRAGRPDGCDAHRLHGHGLPAPWEWAPRNRVCPLARYLRTVGGLPRASVGLWTWGTGRVNEELPLPNWVIRAVPEFDSTLIQRTS